MKTRMAILLAMLLLTLDLARTQLQPSPERVWMLRHRIQQVQCGMDQSEVRRIMQPEGRGTWMATRSAGTNQQGFTTGEEKADGVLTYAIDGLMASVRFEVAFDGRGKVIARHEHE